MVTLWKAKHCKNPKLLLSEPSLLQTQEILRKMDRKKIRFDSVLESSSLEVLAQLLVSGAGCAILPERVVRAFSAKGLVKIPESPVFEDRVCLIYRPDFRKTKRGHLLVDAVRGAF